MTSKSNKKRPTTFSELGMKFTQQTDCPNCQTGSCHNRASGKYEDREYSIYVSVSQTHCTEDCTSVRYEICVSENSSTFSGDELNRTFDNEIDAVNYLLDTFVDFKCGPW